MELNSETVLVEIKCPFKYKDMPFINYEESQVHGRYLEFIDDVLELRKVHQYFTQIQVQLYILNLQRALLYVYTPAQSVIVKVNRDEPFLWDLILKME